MKRERQIIDQRRKNILKYLKANSDISIEELSNTLEVSKATINRDLNELKKGGYINRSYGDIAINNDVDIYDKKGQTGKSGYKEAIAKHAASLIEENDVIFINSSFTALAILKYITGKRVTVVTNNANAFNIPHSHLVTILLTGGELREAKGVMVGDFAINNLKRISVKKCFIGCSGLSVERGVTTENVNEVNINELMLTGSNSSVYVLADKNKIGEISSFVSCSIHSVKNVITNADVSKAKISQFEDMRINILYASENQ